MFVRVCSVVLPSGGVALSYFSVVNFYALCATYGLMFGLGVGLAYVNPLSCAMRVSVCGTKNTYSALIWLTVAPPPCSVPWIMYTWQPYSLN